MPVASAVEIEWVTVGDPGNAADTRYHTPGYGAVPYTYQIAKHEITNAQYAEFLNAVAAEDPNGLFYGAMEFNSTFGGITRSGPSGSFSYSAKAGFENKPVNFVSGSDAMRFANWLQNGQPTGVLDWYWTDTGAYTITAAGIAAGTITRSPWAMFFLTSEDEWYKAAYYNAVTSSYYDYPTGTNTPTVCVAPTPTPNSANCWPAMSPSAAQTPVGSYTGSPSPSGTFDQGGNVWEWTERTNGTFRGFRGGSSWDGGAEDLHAGVVLSTNGLEDFRFGFRVARLLAPPPSEVPFGDIAGPAIAGLLVFTGLLGLAYRRRRSVRAEFSRHVVGGRDAESRALAWRVVMRIRVPALLCLIPLVGCSTLIKGPYDTPGERTAKTWKRVALGVGTVGLAEIWVHRREKHYARHWAYWFDRLSLANAVEGGRTNEDLARVFGGIPACSSDGQERLCQWTADSRTYSVVTSGIRIYSSSLYESSVVQTGGDVYRIICALPKDGSERAPDTCTHWVNGLRFSETEFRTCFGRWESYCPRFEDVKAGIADRQWQRSEFIGRAGR